MAVEIAWDPRQEIAIMWDNTTDTAFGPVFSGPSADVEVQEFIDWLRRDPRKLQASALRDAAKRWSELPTAVVVEVIEDAD